MRQVRGPRRRRLKRMKIAVAPSGALGAGGASILFWQPSRGALPVLLLSTTRAESYLRVDTVSRATSPRRPAAHLADGGTRGGNLFKLLVTNVSQSASRCTFNVYGGRLRCSRLPHALRCFRSLNRFEQQAVRAANAEGRKLLRGLPVTAAVRQRPETGLSARDLFFDGRREGEARRRLVPPALIPARSCPSTCTQTCFPTAAGLTEQCWRDPAVI